MVRQSSKVLVLILCVILTTQATTVVWDMDETTDYTQGGDNWTGTCAEGKMQSPINIDIQELYDLETAYVNVTFPNIQDGKIRHEHDTLDTDYDAGHVDYEINGKKSHWDTVQFHFHAPSEHRVNSKEYAAEMHFRNIKVNEADKFLQFAILLDYDEKAEDDPFFEELKIDNFTDGTTKVLENVNIQRFFHELGESNILKYEGSRTRPPCQEDTVWLVIRNTIKINKKQLNYFHALWKDNPNFANGRGNNRNLQHRNGRRVYLLTEEDTAKYHWIIVGSSIGFALIVIMTVAVICYFRYKKQKQRNLKINQTVSDNSSARLLYNDQ